MYTFGLNIKGSIEASYVLFERNLIASHIKISAAYTF